MRERESKRRIELGGENERNCEGEKEEKARGAESEGS